MYIRITSITCRSHIRLIYGMGFVALFLLAWSVTLSGKAGANGAIVDEFESAKEWRIANDRTPGDVRSQNGRLIVNDHEGGEETWGCAAYRQFKSVNLDELPFFVVDVAGMTDRFVVKLIYAGEKERIIKRNRTGPVAVDIPGVTGWEGTGPVSVGLYALGPGSRVAFERMAFKSQLSPEEENALLPTPPEPVKRMPDHAGLEALAEREGTTPKPPDPTVGERTIYPDPGTGRNVWRLTAHPGIDRHEYYDIRAWNNTGELILFMSERRGNNWWLMDADGTNIRPLPEPTDGGSRGKPRWSRAHPYSVVFSRPGDDEIRVVRMDVRDGDVTQLVTVPEPRVREDGRKYNGLEPPHPDGEWFLLRWGGQDRHKTFAVAVDRTTGNYHELDLQLPAHRLRFTRHPNHSIYYNSNQTLTGEKTRTEWVVTLDGEERRLPRSGTHPDWTPDGSLMAGFKGGRIWLIPYDGSERRELVRTYTGGHGGYSVTTGDYHVGDATNDGPYRNRIFVTNVHTGDLEVLSYHGASYKSWSSGYADPEATHPSPVSSPDETKILYDSDLLGQPDLYMVVWKQPDAPRNVKFSNGILSWEPPVMKQELAGYNVYRRRNETWKRCRDQVQGRRVTGLEDGRYAVSAQEHSGLESGFRVAGENNLTTRRSGPDPPEAPTVEKTERDHVILSWSSVSGPVSHYNVYAVRNGSERTPEDIPSRATLVGSPASPRFVDWGLRSDTTYHYRITAVDAQGNESTPGPVREIRTDR